MREKVLQTANAGLASGSSSTQLNTACRSPFCISRSDFAHPALRLDCVSHPSSYALLRPLCSVLPTNNMHTQQTTTTSPIPNPSDGELRRLIAIPFLHSIAPSKGRDLTRLVNRSTFNATYGEARRRHRFAAYSWLARFVPRGEQG